MSSNPPVTRRNFIQTTAVAAAAAPYILPGKVWSAETNPNERIAMGFIGVGKQGGYLLYNFLRHHGTQVVAVSDVDSTRRKHAKQTVEEYYSTIEQKDFKGCSEYPDFRDLLARKDIDAVCIATPDHWHALVVDAAARAGKDIYCEKPLSLTIHEAITMVKVVRENQRVFQTGSMQRSSSEFHKACELVRNGRIGRVQTVLVGVGGPSRWCDLPEETMEPGLDWDMWLGPAPKRPYNSILSPRGVHNFFPNWRNYREYSGGGMTDWGAHHFDIAQWGLGMDNSGPVEVIPPDHPLAGAGVRYRYANHIEMIHDSHADGVTFFGTEGKIYVNRGKFKATPESAAAEPIGANEIHLYKSRNHLANFLECVRSRQRPICDVAIGARSVTVCHLGNLAYWNCCRLRWDPEGQHFVDDGDTWQDRLRQDPWQLG